MHWIKHLWHEYIKTNSPICISNYFMSATLNSIEISKYDQSSISMTSFIYFNSICFMSGASRSILVSQCWPFFRRTVKNWMFNTSTFCFRATH